MKKTNVCIFLMKYILVLLACPLTGHAADNEFEGLKQTYRDVGDLISNVNTFDKIQLFQGKSSNPLWSYLSSPMIRGGMAFRPDMQKDLGDWSQYFALFQQDNSLQLYQNDELGRLSAMEKYDYLFSGQPLLFEREIDEAQTLFRKYGQIPSWIGMCHGSAPASIAVLRPEHEVTVVNFEQKSLIFSSADIKRLVSYVWGENIGPTVMIGKRCQQYITDGVLRPECRDPNPRDFHLALLNYVGVYKKSFVVDISNGPEVWNHPVVGFSFDYMNVNSRNISQNLSRALVPKEKVINDLHKAQRLNETKAILGIVMKLEVVVSSESEDDDQLRTQSYEYIYDLEVNDQGTIVGGQWANDYHPDFFWSIDQEARPDTIQDGMLEGVAPWDGKSPLSDRVIKLSRQAQEKGKVMNYLVMSLLKLSSAPLE